MDLAASEYQAVIDLDSKNALAYYRMGDVYGQRANTSRQIEFYRKALKINSRLADARCDLGVAYFHKNDLDKAIKELKRAVRDKPDLAKGHYYLASLFLNKAMGTKVHRKKYLNQSLARLKKAIQYKPELHQAHHKLGRVYQELGDNEKAREAYKTAIKLAPDFQEAKLDLEKLEKDSGGK
jgi:Tfp pilus assembly protein PilF